ncbi:hypothetical protein F11_08855 [Rhodospirillum rubrum F11]|nr:hypothetical protein F11_08855 [Rhodospirillum rubrum F11]
MLYVEKEDALPHQDLHFFWHFLTNTLLDPDKNNI